MVPSLFPQFTANIQVRCIIFVKHTKDLSLSHLKFPISRQYVYFVCLTYMVPTFTYHVQPIPKQLYHTASVEKKICFFFKACAILLSICVYDCFHKIHILVSSPKLKIRRTLILIIFALASIMDWLFWILVYGLVMLCLRENVIIFVKFN